MEISDSTNTGGPGQTSGAQQQQQSQAQSLGNSNLGKEDFLQLLVAQMKNQDPINPMDGTQFASQLAQFNSVEQLINLNDGMNLLAESQQMMNTGLSNTMAASLAGKSVRALSDKIALEPGGSGTLQFKLNNVATSADITIRDGSGNVVRTEELGSLGSGEHTWTWDGLSDDGSRLPEGVYSIEVNAANGDQQVDALTYTEGFAEKVSYSGEGVRLLVNGIYVPLGDVEQIGLAEGQ